MNKITIDGQEYEVLTLDRISEVTHAKLAGGRVVRTYYDATTLEKTCDYRHGIGISCWADLGIQPLKLIDRVPVEFVIKVGTNGLGDAQINERPPQSAIGKKFRCVEVVE